MHTYREEKESFEKKIHDNNREIEKVEMLLKYIDLEASIREDAENFKNVQFPYFVRRNNTSYDSYHRLKKEDYYTFK
jgi:uncharacterized protein YeeX (DUF496 family)